MKKHRLEFYMHDGSTAFRFEVSGHLSQDGARSLEQAWRTAASTIGGRDLILDLTSVTGADEDGRALIIRWHREGARLIANSQDSRNFAESVLGAPLAAHESKASEHARVRFCNPFLAGIAIVLLLAAVLFPAKASAANLQITSAILTPDF
jgi:hypothetical protein